VSVWYPSIDQARQIVLADHAADARPQVREITRVLRTQTEPLLAAALLTTCSLLPKALGVPRGAVDALANRGAGAVSEYDAVQATFVLVVVFTALLAVQAASWTVELIKKRRSAPQ
jgi:hypothetical protein